MKSFIIIISFSLFLTSCSDIFSENDVKGVTGKIIFAGSEESDGCGWLLMLSEMEEYKPSSLSEEFKINGLEVKVSFKDLDTIYSCGFASGYKIEKVRITKIEKI